MQVTDHTGCIEHVSCNLHGSFIFNNATGECNALREEAGNYMLDVYIAPVDESGAAFARPH